MGVGCILYRNYISRPTKVDALGGLIFVCFFWICSMEKQLYDVVVRKMESDEEGEVLFCNIAGGTVIGCVFREAAVSRLSD